MEISCPKNVLMKSIEDSCGLTAYSKTLQINNINISTDTEYQKNYTNYYRVRRDKEWLRAYYTYMEKVKNRPNITFEEIIRYLSSIPHKVKVSSINPTGYATTIEASFSSKMLATINPDYPIWDSQVVNALGYSVDSTLTKEEKILAYIEEYGRLKKEIDEFLVTDSGKKCIELFDTTFPNYISISPCKKIDFYLWNIGK